VEIVVFKHFRCDRQAMPLAVLSLVLALSSAAANCELLPPQSGSERPATWFAPHATSDTIQQFRPASGVFQASLLSMHGIGTIRLMSNQSAGEAKVTRLETAWSMDLPGRPERLRLGDSVNRMGAWGRPFRFGGLQFGTNLAGDSALITPPSWRIRGMTYGPAPAPQILPPGVPYSDPATSQMFRASFDILGPGVVDHTVAIGFLRPNFALEADRYGPLFASASSRRGVSEHLTAELRGGAQQGLGNCGIAAHVRLPGLGILTGATAISESEGGVGMLAQTGFEYRRANLTASIRSQWSTAEFHPLGPAEESVPPRHWSVARARFDGTRFGVVEMAYVTLARDDDASNRTLEANYRVVVGKASAITVHASRTFEPEPNVSLMLAMTLPLERLARFLGGRATRYDAPSVNR
jgi:outer membrane usher protein